MTWVKWRRSKTHAVVGEIAVKPVGMLIVLACNRMRRGTVGDEYTSEVERGPNPCRQCVAAVERSEAK